MAFISFTVSLKDFITACHEIVTCIQLLLFKIFYFIHIISHYMIVSVVGNSTAFIQTQSLPKLAKWETPDHSMVIFIFTVIVLTSHI